MSEGANCNICGSSKYAVLEEQSPYLTLRCKECGFVYVFPTPPKDTLLKNYNKEYYEPWIKTQDKARQKLWEWRLKKVERLKEKGLLLDVGCGDGTFLNKAKENGWQVRGTEISEYAVKYIKGTFGIDVNLGVLRQASFPDDFFDVVTLWHVLEHVDDPLDSLKETHRVLKRNGVLIVAVPNLYRRVYNMAYMLTRFKRPRVFSQYDREIHIFHFSKSTLKRILEEAGFKDISIGIDLGRALTSQRILDMCAAAIYGLFGVNWGMALEARAKK